MQVDAVRPSVTVLVPTYRRPELLEVALRSALAQTFSDFEVLVVDNDAGGEVNGEVIASLDDDRIVHVRRDTNVGGFQNWVDGVRRARADVVASLHDDDIWEPGFLEAVACPLVQDPTVVAGFCGYSLIDADGALLESRTSRLEANTRLASHEQGISERSVADLVRGGLVEGAFQIAYAGAFRRALVAANQFPTWTDPLYDLWFNYLLARRPRRVLVVHERLTRYRLHDGQVTVASPYVPQILACYSRMLDDPAFAGHQPALRRRMGYFTYVHATDLMRQGRADEASELFRSVRGLLSGRDGFIARVAGSSPAMARVGGPVSRWKRSLV